MKHTSLGKAGIGIAAATTLVLTGCGSDDDSVTVRIGALSTAGTLTAGQSTGVIEDVLDEHGYDVSWEGPFPAFAPAAEAAAADQIDASSGSTSTFLTALESDTELVLLGVETLTSGIVATGDSGITSLEELEGARVAVNAGGTGEYLLHRALEHAGVEPDTVEFENLSPPDAATAFSSGDIDAWATWDQYFATAELAEGATILAEDEDIESLNFTFHWVTKAFYDEHPEAVEALTDAIDQSSEAVAANPDLIIELYEEYGADPAVVELLETYDVPDFTPATEQDVEDLETLGEELVRYGMIDEVPEIEPYVALQD